MKRRSFLKGTTALSGLRLTASCLGNTDKKKINKPLDVCATIEQQKVSFYAETINESIKVIHIADTQFI